MALVEHMTQDATGALRPIAFEISATHRDLLDGLGRTEDLRFAPGGRRFAIACYKRSRIVLADVEIAAGPAGPEIAVTRLEEVTSPALGEPHGVEFLDDETLLVASRGVGLTVLRLSPASRAVEPIHVLDLSPESLLDSPGSVAARRSGSGRHEVLVCNNWSGRVTRHVVDGDGRPVEQTVAAKQWLDVPDGVAISHGQQWIAVSNHNTHSVLVFDHSAMSPEADPVAVLRGVRYPHGLRFDESDRRLLVADAGAPYVHLFVAPPGGWAGASYPAASIRVMDDETFTAGQHTPQEGGPKGIDLHPEQVLAITAESTPVAFFDLRTALASDDGPEAANERLVAYELYVLAEKARFAQAAADVRAQLTAIQSTKAWRVMQPARNAYSALRRVSESRRRRAG